MQCAEINPDYFCVTSKASSGSQQVRETCNVKNKMQMPELFEYNHFINLTV